jgi:hypothetical protein
MFLCREFANSGYSGIITTNRGKTATFTAVAGRERRVHHSKSLPLLVTGERFFFVPTDCIDSVAGTGGSPAKRFIDAVFRRIVREQGLESGPDDDRTSAASLKQNGKRLNRCEH